MSNSRIEVAIRALGADRFEPLMQDLLKQEGYTVDPTGTSGPDGGRDAFLSTDDREGVLHCSVQKTDWEGKAHDDAEKAVENFDRDFDFYVFATTQDPGTTKRDRVEEELSSTWGMSTTVWDFSKIRNTLVGGDNGDLIWEHLSVDPKNPWTDIESQVDAVYEKQLERLKRREAPEGYIVDDVALVCAHVIPQEAVDEHHDRYSGDLPHPPIFAKRDEGATERPKLKLSGDFRTVAPDEPVDRYTAIHRDGWTEGIFTAMYPSDSDPALRTSVDPALTKFVESGISSLYESEIYPPYYVYITLLDADGYTLNYPANMSGPTVERPFQDSEIRLNRVRIDNPDDDIPATMRKTFDQLWRHCGWSDGSIHYKERKGDGGEIEFQWNPFH